MGILSQTIQSKCTCDPEEDLMGTGEVAINQLLPFPTERYPEPGTKVIGIDKCILPEVHYLWSKGIQTVESCCGHGRVEGYIAVEERHIEEMQQLGYIRATSESVFLSKTCFLESGPGNYDLRVRTKRAVINHLMTKHGFKLPEGYGLEERYNKAYPLITKDHLRLILDEQNRVRGLGRIGIIDIENALSRSGDWKMNKHH